MRITIVDIIYFIDTYLIYDARLYIMPVIKPQIFTNILYIRGLIELGVWEGFQDFKI